MLLGSVDFPEALLASARKGRLVIFAGAGVSMGAPSNLPSFRGLAERVGSAAAPGPGSEPLDQYLGRCELLDVNVQLRTREILDAPGSRPTPLHFALIGLFGAPDRVRVVTTNFDRHFRTAADELYGPGAVAGYWAPALPLGRDASGIIHLHGALEVARHPLVITDADFGRAYLTEGWAARFLLDLFLNNTVCFVGYSHGDVVIRYLARALPPNTVRYALTESANDADWAALGIRPIHYSLRAGGDHAALTEALQAWVVRTRMGALDHEQQIKELVAVPPPTEPELLDYLRAALVDPSTRTFFLRYARGPEWLRFASDTGVLDGLFGTDAKADNILAPLAFWLAESFMLEFPEDLLALLRRNRMEIGPVLWQLLARRLATVTPRPQAELIARWITVLVVRRREDWSPDFLTTILAQCPSEALPSALVLFDHLVQPQVTIKDPWVIKDGTDVSLRLEVSTIGDHHDLRDAWEKVLRPALSSSYPAVASIVGACLTRVHQLLLTAGAATATWDPISFGRSAIEPHQQDSYPSDVDVLIDIAREVLEFAIENDSGGAQALIELWERSASRLLRRLAIHGRTQSEPLVASDELERILTNGWLQEVALKHEVFRLLAKAYGAADETSRAAFLDRALAG